MVLKIYFFCLFIGSIIVVVFIGVSSGVFVLVMNCSVVMVFGEFEGLMIVLIFCLFSSFFIRVMVCVELEVLL